MAVAVASSTGQARAGNTIPILVPENGFISINPPLTGARIGSLSTKTTHPFILSGLNHVLEAGTFGVRLTNPYQLRTKGEMLLGSPDQVLLRRLASSTTSCGRFSRYRVHCGKCLPCLIRRAAFTKWGQPDQTEYRFADLREHANAPGRFDDVRSAATAILEARTRGFDRWCSGALAPSYFANDREAAGIGDTVMRGLSELEVFLQQVGVL
jgi:hypothetical protein